MFTGIVTVPSVPIGASPMTLPSLVMFTLPSRIGSPVTGSVTLAVIVVFPAVLLDTVASI